MSAIPFASAFQALTGNTPFPWQEAMYELMAKGSFEELASCNLPTGLGKTSVIAIWLIALANAPDKVPRRLAYVVNRRTVVDQATDEAAKIRGCLTATDCPPVLKELKDNLARLAADPNAGPLAISTLRGQFADNGDWRSDPARPAVIVGTVDMIGSRLLFSGYGIGFKTKPLHAGFLGQHVLLVHDEAHLEPPFQKLIERVRDEQETESVSSGEKMRLKVMALTATPRGTGKPFELTDKEKSPPDHLPAKLTKPVHFVWQRLRAKKGILFHTPAGEKKVAEQIGELAKNYARSNSGSTILVYVNSLEDHANVCRALSGEKVQVLTGTLRGLERDQMVDPRKETGCPIFARFLKPPTPGVSERERWKVAPAHGTVYLVCTSAGEVGVDISADHLVCDLAAFDRMAQRFGRVNRYGTGDANIDVVHDEAPDKKKENDPNDHSRWKTLELLKELPIAGNRRSASPFALMELRNRDDLNWKLDVAYSPKPVILPTTDIIFDAWAMTTVKGKLPGRPPVNQYLHGVEDDKQAETYVAWRDEVWLLRNAALTDDQLTELLDDYPLKPHELLRDSTYRKGTGVRDQLEKLAKHEGNAEHGSLPVWIHEPGGEVHATTLELAAKLPLSGRTVILPPDAGGLVVGDGVSRGLLNGAAGYDPANRHLYDVADVLQDTKGNPFRLRQRTIGITAPPRGMRRVAAVCLRPESDDEDGGALSENDPNEGELTHLQFFARPNSADDDGSKTSRATVLLGVHTIDVTNHARRIVNSLPLPEDLKEAVILAAKFHDIAKKRLIFQRGLGNMDPNAPPWAKSRGKTHEFTGYRHEFGSLLDVQDAEQPFCAEFQHLSDGLQDLVLHLIAAHHGRARPHFPPNEAFDPERNGKEAAAISAEVPRRFARLLRKHGRWGLAYLESLLRAADYAASAAPSATVEEDE